MNQLTRKPDTSTEARLLWQLFPILGPAVTSTCLEKYTRKNVNKMTPIILHDIKKEPCSLFVICRIRKLLHRCKYFRRRCHIGTQIHGIKQFYRVCCFKPVSVQACTEVYYKFNSNVARSEEGRPRWSSFSRFPGKLPCQTTLCGKGVVFTAVLRKAETQFTGFL